MRLSVYTGIGGGISSWGLPTTLQQQIDLMREAESLGLLHLAASGDSSQNGLYGNLAMMAEHTEKAKVMSIVTHPLNRWPTVAAGEISMTQWISGGRAVFCIGTGGGVTQETFRQMGRKPARIAELREYATAVKGLCAGQKVQFQGHELEIWGDTPPSNVPLWLDISGPKGMRMAGEIADGAIVPYGISKEAVQHLKAGIAEGAKAAGRDPEKIELWWIPPVELGKTREEAIEKVKFYLAMRTRTILSYPEQKAVPERFWGPIREFRSHYEPTHHARSEFTANGEWLDRVGITEWAADRHAIVGPPEAIVDRLHEIREWGVTNILFGLRGDTREALHIFADKILPNVS